MDKRVKAIREDKRIGRGTCSTIDECYDDSDLIELLDEYDVKYPIDAVKWAIVHERLWRGKALDCRWGEDSDPELEWYNNVSSMDE